MLEAANIMMDLDKERRQAMRRMEEIRRRIETVASGDLTEEQCRRDAVGMFDKADSPEEWGYARTFLATKYGEELASEIIEEVNMNLCRKHVIYLRSRVETDLDPEYYPDEYGLEIPEEVDNNYMADPDGIRSRTKAALEVLKENQDFQYLRNKLSGDLDKESDQCMNSVRYVLGLEDAIQRDDLVVMRRCQDPEFYVNYLRNSRKKLEVILGSEYLEPKIREGQLTIWDFIGGQ